jgi:hypothetical protein
MGIGGSVDEEEKPYGELNGSELASSDLIEDAKMGE